VAAESAPTTRPYFKYYNSRYGAAESEADGWFTAACGPMVYQGPRAAGIARAILRLRTGGQSHPPAL
jgi:hypothetical protein